MKKIDLEAHFATKEWIDALLQNKGYPRLVEDKAAQTRRMYFTSEAFEPFTDVLLGNLLDVGEKRLKAMDDAGVGMQVLTLTAPGVESLDPQLGEPLAKSANNALAEIIRKYPERFSGYAALAPKRPEQAARELERAVKELGLKGWKTHSNYGDSYIDEKAYWPILAKAEELDVPIYLHPTATIIPQLRAYGFALAGTAFGFGVETAMAMMRLVLGGVFDAFPKLRVILGHLGEGLPFILQRIDFPFTRPHFKKDPGFLPALKKRPSDYLKNNMFVTTSGNYLQPAFICTKDAMGIDRVLLGTDYPYEDSGECMRFLESVPLSKTDREKVYSLNAKQLGIKAQIGDAPGQFLLTGGGASTGLVKSVSEVRPQLALNQSITDSRLAGVASPYFFKNSDEFREVIRSFNGKTPKIAESAFVSEAAYVVGDVEIGEESSVWPCAVIRGDFGKIQIGRNVAVEDNCVIHSGTPSGPMLDVVIGDRVIIGHGAVLNCKSIGNNVLLGMNATVLHDVEIGNNCVIGAGCLVTQGAKIPDHSFVVGVPGEIKGEPTERQLWWAKESYKQYLELVARYKREGL